MNNHRSSKDPPDRCECGSKRIRPYQKIYYICLDCATLLSQIPDELSSDRSSKEDPFISSPDGD